MRPKSWIGVDVSKRFFVAAQRSSEGLLREKFAMNAEGFEAFRLWLPQGERCVVLEATGPYWRPLACWLESLEEPIPYAVVNPRRVRRFAEASAERSKDDWIDAATLVHFAETFEPRVEKIKSPVYRELRAIWRHHLTLTILREQLRDQREKMLADPQVPASLAEGLADLIEEVESQRQQLESACIDRLQQDPKARQTYRLLLSIASIGPKTALTLMAECGARLNLASARQLTSFIGFDPIRFESGSSISHPPHISKQGNWRLRRALYLAALSAIRFNPPIVDFYNRRLRAGMSKKAAVVAAARKLLNVVAGVLHSEVPFEKNLKRA
jgi:transposase